MLHDGVAVKYDMRPSHDDVSADFQVSLCITPVFSAMEASEAKNR